MAAVFAQLTGKRELPLRLRMDVMPGKMGFICSRDSKVFFVLNMSVAGWQACGKGDESRLLPSQTSGYVDLKPWLGTSPVVYFRLICRLRAFKPLQKSVEAEGWKVDVILRLGYSV